MKTQRGKQGISSAVEPETRKIQRNPGISLLRAQIDPSESEGATSLISTTLFLVSQSVHRQALLPRTGAQALRKE